MSLFRVPAEWERHSCTWLAWPHNESTFPQPILSKVEEIYCEIVYQLVSGEVVKILVNGEEEADRVYELLSDAGVDMSRVDIHMVPTMDVWVRDYAPIFVKRAGDGGLVGVKWKFNAWGLKYPELAVDDEAGRRILELSGASPLYRPYVIEGGGLEFSGDGLVLATKECLLNPSRNRGSSLEELERELREFLGAAHVIWFDRGLVGDDTDGHVDTFCRFTAPKIIALAEEHRENINRRILDEAYETLERVDREMELGLEILRVPFPQPVRVLDQEVPATYMNFYVGNRSILVPTFGVPEDEDALSLLSECFRHRRVVGVNCRELFYGFGGIHCITMQQPV